MIYSNITEDGSKRSIMLQLSCKILKYIALLLDMNC